MYRDYIPKKILPVPPQSVLTTLELRFINDCVRTSRQGPVLRLPSIQPYACSGTSRKHPYVGDNKANSKVSAFEGRLANNEYHEKNSINELLLVSILSAYIIPLHPLRRSSVWVPEFKEMG